MKRVLIIALLGGVALTPLRSAAQADEAAPEPSPIITPVSEEPAPATEVAGTVEVRAEAPAEPPPPAEAPDGVRFRGAIAAAGGGEFVSNFAFGMGGVEGRVGVQINNLIGLYIQPYLAFGAGSVGSGVTGFTGTAGVSALIDFTIADRFFIGAGGGVGVLNNPWGPEIHFRIGGYPAMAVGEDGYSRQGLMIGVDARLFLLDSFGTIPVMQVMGSIGYEVF